MRYIQDFFKILSNGSMSYVSYAFLIFLIFFMTLYFCVINSKAKKYVLLVGNFVFYIWSGLHAFMYVFLTALVAYLVSLKIGKIYKEFDENNADVKPKDRAKALAPYKARASVFMYLSLLAIIGVWVFVKICKYRGVANVGTFNDMFSGMGIIVPLGISYYTLSITGYVLDVFWRKTEPVKNYFDVLIVMTYFPHIVQGPISKYSDLIPQINKLPRFDYVRFCHGLQRMLWGFIKKLIIADRLVIYTNEIFLSGNYYTGFPVLIAVILSVFQLYADFSGCMDIIMGISEIIGIELAPNFRQPLFAKNATEFWARWHMSLGQWTKEYIYLPVSMNPRFLKLTRKLKKSGKERFSSFLKAFVPLILVWIFTGLWHGTGVDYIAWGLYWCILMTISNELDMVFKAVQKKSKINVESKKYSIFQMLRTFAIFAIGRTFTAAGNLYLCAVMWKRMLVGILRFTSSPILPYNFDIADTVVAVLGIILIIIVDIIHEKNISIRDKVDKIPLIARWIIYYTAIMAVMIFGIYGEAFNASAFVYGAF